MDLALCVVEAAGAGPAIRATKHRAAAIFAAHARELRCEQADHLVPGALDEVWCEVAFAARLALEP